MAKLPHCVAAALLLCPPILNAQARFDLAGPKIDVHVTRAGVTLPIARVPNLQAGDQIWVHPNFDEKQSVHYLLIATFLRGTTNPPPDEWFTRIETWNKHIREEGVTVTVPAGAQQAILFLAPETGGDFGTLRSAVKGRPGIFVRAAQDLSEAGFEQARIEKYLDSMKRVPPGDSAAVAEHSNLLARTLNLRPNPECFKRPLDQQLSCLTQTGTQTLLDDGHAESIVAALSTGPGSDFINAASNTKLAMGGNYSAYVGAMVDLARLLNGIHTAQYQYIPAIAFPDSAREAGGTEVNPGVAVPSSPESLSLRLNTAPSFHNPKSVIVIGLPAVAAAVPPPLRPADPNHISCLLDPRMVLPIEGAPLVFSTAYAHSLVLHLNLPAAAADIPLTPDAYQGGLVPSPAPAVRKELPLLPVRGLPGLPAQAPKPATPLPAAVPGAPLTGTIMGLWGFDAFTGPTLPVQQLPGQGWRIAAPDANLIAGHPNHLQLESTGTACIRAITLDGKVAIPFKLGEVKAPQVPPVDLTLNLQTAATPGSIRLEIQQFGKTDPDQLGTKTFSEPAKLETLRIHAGDATATLTGTSLNEVNAMTFDHLAYRPSGPASPALLLSTEKVPGLKANDRLTAKVELKDGRTLEIATTVLPPRPEIGLLSRRAILPAPNPITISSPDVLPLGAQYLFFLKSKASIPRGEQIEIANSDESLHTTLSIAAGTLVLQDAHTLLATFDPLKTFGPSTFGAFRVRALAPDGTEGEWLPLATIVRLPTLTALHCPKDPALGCSLEGSALYLIDAVSLDLAFTAPTQVPEGFVEGALAVPRTVGGMFYLRLRDDPSTTHLTTMVVTTP